MQVHYSAEMHSGDLSRQWHHISCKLPRLCPMQLRRGRPNVRPLRLMLIIVGELDTQSCQAD